MSTPIVTPDPVLDTGYGMHPTEPRSQQAPEISRSYRLSDDFLPPEVPADLRPPDPPPVEPPAPPVDPPPAPPVAPSPDGQTQPVKVMRTIDLKDGSGVQVFEAEAPTLEAAQNLLLDKIADAQVHATRKIRELRDKAKAKPNKTVVPQVRYSPKQVTDQELLDIKALWETNPVEAFQKLQEITLGMKAEVLVNAVEATQNQQTKNKVDTDAVEFVADHLEDFDNSPESGKAIYDFLRGCTRTVTEGGFNCTFCNKTHDPSLMPYKENLEYAFEQLSETGVNFMKKKPAAEPVVPPPPPPPVAVTPPPPAPPVVVVPPAPPAPNLAVPVPPPPVSVSDRSGQRPPAPDTLEGVDAAKLINAPLHEMRAGIQRLSRGR